MIQNFEIGFTAALGPERAEWFRTLAAGATVDPRVDEEWEAWRCPGCGKSHAEIGIGHAWRTQNGQSTCNGQPRSTT